MRRRNVLRIVAWAAAVALAVCFASNLFAAEKSASKAFRAGAAKSNITPPLGISMPGGMSDRKATNIHDELHARCLVLDNGAERIAVAVCDAVAIGSETVLRAKRLIETRTGIPPDHVLIAATHTHSGGATVSVFQSDADPAYLDWVAVRIADGVQRAANNLRPARIGWGLGREDRAVFNRRYVMKPGTMPPDPWGRTSDTVKMNPGVENPNVVKPAGPTDPGLPVVAFRDLEGDPIAVLSNYALHYVGGERSGDISADYYGMWAEMIERDFAAPPKPAKPPLVAIMTNGCSGNINNVDVRARRNPPSPYYQMDQVARMVADDVLGVLREMAYQDWVPLAARETPLELRIRKPSSQDINEAQRLLEKAGPQLRSLSEVYARETVLLDKWEDTIKSSVEALRMGDVGIVAFPGEAFAEMGLEVKAKSPFPLTFCIDLSNGYIGYIPTVAAFDVGGYETWRARSSPLARGAAPILVNTALDSLKRLRLNSGGD